MNRLLFDALTFINGFLAIVIVLACTFVGARAPALAGMQPFGVILGVLMGVALAALICGSLAFFALVERHLRTIAEAASGTPRLIDERQSRADPARREPSI